MNGYCDRLEERLRQLEYEGLITIWYDKQITAGDQWEYTIMSHLNNADVILFLVSPDFTSSDYCYNIEMPRALERWATDNVLVIPIILRTSDLEHTPLAHLQWLPSGRQVIPISRWTDQVEAFVNVTQGIRRAIEPRLLQRYQVSSQIEQRPPQQLPSQQMESIPRRRSPINFIISLVLFVILPCACCVFGGYSMIVAATKNSAALQQTATRGPSGSLIDSNAASIVINPQMGKGFNQADATPQNPTTTFKHGEQFYIVFQLNNNEVDYTTQKIYVSAKLYINNKMDSKSAPLFIDKARVGGYFTGTSKSTGLRNN